MSDKNYLSTYAKSFNWAGFFLPKETYKKCSALYDFCRVIDNIADDCDLLENKEKKFEQFQNNFKTKNNVSTRLSNFFLSSFLFMDFLVSSIAIIFSLTVKLRNIDAS